MQKVRHLNEISWLIENKPNCSRLLIMILIIESAMIILFKIIVIILFQNRDNIMYKANLIVESSKLRLWYALYFSNLIIFNMVLVCLYSRVETGGYIVKDEFQLTICNVKNKKLLETFFNVDSDISKI